MSACNAFTEHVWKPGECKNCFKPKNLHHLPPVPERSPVSNSNLKTNAIHSSNHHTKNTGNFRPPVAKKPTIAVKPTMMMIDGQSLCGEISSPDLCENKSAVVGWNQNRIGLKKKTLNNNNNEEEEEEENIESYSHIHRPFGNNDNSGKAPGNNNGLTEVLKEIAGLDHSSLLIGNEINSKEAFLGRINNCYKKSLERKIPPSCMTGGTKSQNKHVVLSGNTAVISNEGGRFCYPELSSGDESEDDMFFERMHEDHESWDESDEELLAMEIRMRGQPRFANFRANTLSPVQFCVDKKWNTVPLRHKSLQRFCAVDYDDSYDEILNGYGNDPIILYGHESIQSIVSSDSMSPDSSLTEESHSGTASSSSQRLCNGRVSPSNPKDGRSMEDGCKGFCDDQIKVAIKNTQNASKMEQTHKAVLAIRLEENDGKTIIQSHNQDCQSLSDAPIQTTAADLIPIEEQAKPYRVVNMEQPVCKPYTIVDVSAAMTNESMESQTRNIGTRYVLSNANSPEIPSTNSVSHSVSCGQVTADQSNTVRYQEVWTSSTSPRQKNPKMEVTANVPGPSIPIKRNTHKSAPTSPTSTNMLTKTIPVKSPNLSEIKFNSYNNAGMPPFPIIIHDEPTYARCSKNAIKVPIVINPNAYDNLAIYKSFLGTHGDLSVKDKTTSIISHTYEEIETESTISENVPNTCKSSEISQAKSIGSSAERRLGSVAQKVQEFNSCLGKGQNSPKSSCHGSPTKRQGTVQEPLVKGEHIQEMSSSIRENACTILSQIVASIQPPQSPPEASQPNPKSCSVEELYSLPPDTDTDKSILVRPKSLFSVQSKPNAEGLKSTEVLKETPSRSSGPQPSKPGTASQSITSPKTEQPPPFPPPRSTSSPYHASKMLQKHFNNWNKPTNPVRSTEAESILHSEGRRAVNAKPKRWISFKSFFRRRKTEEEEEDREREKGKLVGLDGTVIHMLPPPPVQRHNWFSESRTDSSEKSPIVFTFKCDQAKIEAKSEQNKTQVESASDAVTTERGEKGKPPESLEGNLKSHYSSPKEILSQAPDEQQKPIENVSPQIPAPTFEKQGCGSPTYHTPELFQVEDDREEMSDSSDVSACSATYSNLGESRAAMIPPKQPRQVKGALEDAIGFGGLDDPEITGTFHPTPPPLPKKTILRAHTEPLPKQQQKQTVEGGLCVVANPTYDLDTNWEGSSACSSASSEFKAVDNESGDSLDRPSGKVSSTANSFSSLSIKKRCSNSLESLSGRPIAHSKHSRAAQKPQRQALYKGIENREEVVSKIRGLHTDSLKKLSVKCEDLFMAGQKDQLRFGLDSWSDFRLASDKPCCEAGDAVYYPASYAKDSHNSYAVKICKSKANESQQYYHSLAIRQSLAIHFNIQQDCGHFLADVPVRLLPWEDPSSPEENDAEGGGDEQKINDGGCPGAVSQKEDSGLQRSRVVVITREVPCLTVADFVQGSLDRHSSCPDLYERQVCLLLLQLCSGLEHLKPYHITHCDLRLENLLLVDYRPGRSLLNNKSLEPNLSASCPARLIVSNFSQAKQKSHMVDPEILRDQSRLAPEIITATQYKKCDEFQTGILIYEMLHLPNPFDETPELKEKDYTRADLPRIPCRSLYSLGLQQLAACLLNPNPSERILISEAKGVLQGLLWGPREDVFYSLSTPARPSQREAVLQNWLDIKRTLLMIKFAEKSLDKECQVSLEEWLCCQYLAFTTINSLGRTVKILQQH